MTEKNTEGKEEISFNEFKAWLTGLIHGKRGQLPDLEDWKQIKVMMDKVELEVETIYVPAPTAPYPTPWYISNPPPFTTTPIPQWNEHTGYKPLPFDNGYSTNSTQATYDNTNISVSLCAADLENLQTKIDEITNSTYSAKINPSEELNIAIDDLIKAQETKV